MARELTRQDAWALMTQHTANESLRKHMLAVEAAMRFYARRFGEDQDLWGITGLLHDFDYEKHPTKEEHPYVGVKLLEELGYPEPVKRAILAHAEHTGVPAETLMEKTLLAVDELTGFIVAVALVRPNKNLAEVKVSSVKKKMKDKAFARAVNRDDIRRGAELLGITLEEHIENVLTAMKGIALELGLAG